MTIHGGQNEVCFSGLDASNPLAFLAALGALRTLSLSRTTGRVSMSWQAAGGAWQPAVRASGGTWSREGILEALDQSLGAPADFRAFTLSPDLDAEPGTWQDKLRVPPEAYRAFLIAVQDSATADSRYAADFAACWSSEVCTIGDGVQDTSFQFTAGQQKFLSMARQLIEVTGRADLERSLFEPWRYTDPGPSMRWDPVDEARQYALQWYDPTNASRNPVVAMRGANRLAIEAIPLFPSVPIGHRLQTAGFAKLGRREVFTWPIWSGWLTVEVVPSLLCLPALQEQRPDRTALGAMGVVEVYRSQVVMPSGRYRCFTPARAA